MYLMELKNSMLAQIMPISCLVQFIQSTNGTIVGMTEVHKGRVKRWGKRLKAK